MSSFRITQSLLGLVLSPLKNFVSILRSSLVILLPAKSNEMGVVVCGRSEHADLVAATTAKASSPSVPCLRLADIRVRRGGDGK